MHNVKIVLTKEEIPSINKSSLSSIKKSFGVSGVGRDFPGRNKVRGHN
jgi:hypothetical protein